ncbi:MAG: Multiple antibiotic resistance protein MarR [Paracidovorax wautersii]|uniref:Multiple antibiotic resistance protein MarR n=1 Tax=Paracidovorax wautersii TaxID=1177982 RepID=A0A7V8FSJ7_9BURK|nr:MAG: Multiple antibiotic resistance protein MarR [Paracidovorax wautersii]
MTEHSASGPNSQQYHSHPRDSAGWLMKAILMHIRAEMDRRTEAVGLTEAQWMPVARLASGQVSTAAALSRDCMQSAGGMTRMLDRLEAKGFVQRVRSRDDRRVVNLELTPQGQSAASQLPAMLRELNEQALADLAPDEVRQFKSYLQRVLSTVENNMSAPASVSAAAGTGSDKTQKSS